MDDASGHVEWREWGEEAFAEARERDAPILLSLVAHWCAECREMDERTYGDPSLAAHVGDSFVPIRVDVDERPRVRDRYNVGGFPSTVFLTPGGEVLTGATYLGPDGFRSAVESVRDVWSERGEDAGRVPRALGGGDPPRGEVGPEIEAHALAAVREHFDAENAGWGSGAKFPLPRTVEFALAREPELATATLDAVTAALLDEYDGGVHRYAATPTWGEVATEKLLDTNAGVLRAFSNAYLVTGEERFRERAVRIVEFLATTLWTGEAFAASQAPDAAYYLGSATDREGSETPLVDPAIYAGANALAVDALCTYVATTDDDRVRRYAERSLSHLLAELVEGGVVSHCEGGERGLLEDQGRVLRATATAFSVLGDREALEVGREIADWTVETLFEDGAFVDGRPIGEGLLDRPLKPIDTTVEVADALCDLSLLADEARYGEVAREAIGAFAGASDRLGAELAGYGAVGARLCTDPLVIRVGEPGSDLHRAALRMADHEKVVVPDPEVAGALAERGQDRLDPVGTPADLESCVVRLLE
ncbi:DUF255 domain-containing protein [Natronorarus salvus]|uniref:DUF255 domain-containing protein n=1 Tax=Natronorarus salvus TaxID=3117733 RepID=UPI002F268E92